jgi:hypothetical protein
LLRCYNANMICGGNKYINVIVWGKKKSIDMADNKGWFKPGNRMYDLTQIGRPEYWTEEKIDEMIDKLEIWLKKDDSICLAGFRGENSLTPDVMENLKRKSTVFARMYKNAQQIVANRMAMKLGNGVHQAHYNKYQSCYDSELKQHDKEMITAAAKAEAQEEDQKEKEKIAKEVSDRVMEQLEAYRSALKMCDKINIKE